VLGTAENGRLSSREGCKLVKRDEGFIYQRFRSGIGWILNRKVRSE